MAINSEWLKSLSPGDEVAVFYHSGYGGGRVYRETVQSVTPAWIVTDGGKYRRSDGGKTGVKQPARCRLDEPWAVCHERLETYRIREKIERRVSTTPLEKLLRIEAILNEEQQP